MRNKRQDSVKKKILQNFFFSGFFLVLKGLNYAYCAYGINYTHPTEGTCPERIAEKYSDCFGPIDVEIHGLSTSEEYFYIQSVTTPCDQTDSTLPYGMTCDTATNVQNYLKYSEINPLPYGKIFPHYSLK